MSKPTKPSKLDIAKYKGDVLNQIMKWKREEVPRQMDLVSPDQVRAFAQIAADPLDFAAALTAQPGASLIAEINARQPFKRAYCHTVGSRTNRRNICSRRRRCHFMCH